MARAAQERMDILKRAAQLLTPYMAEEHRDTWLTLAFHAEHRQVYDTIPQRGATADFVVVCVRGVASARGMPCRFCSTPSVARRAMSEKPSSSP